MDSKDDFTQDKVFSWLISLINVHNYEYRENYVPIWDLIHDVEELPSHESTLTSTLVLDGGTYEFSMKLKKTPVPSKEENK